MSKVLTAIFSVSYTLVRWTHVALGSETELPLAFCDTWVSFLSPQAGHGGGEGGEGRAGAERQGGKGRARLGRCWQSLGTSVPLPRRAPCTPLPAAQRSWPPVTDQGPCRAPFHSLSSCLCQSADWHHIWELIVRHCPAQAMQKAQPAARRARTQQRRTSLSRWSAVEHGLWQSLLCMYLWSRNAGCHAGRGMKRQKIRKIFFIMNLGLARFLACLEILVKKQIYQPFRVPGWIKVQVSRFSLGH